MVNTIVADDLAYMRACIYGMVFTWLLVNKFYQIMEK